MTYFLWTMIVVFGISIVGNAAILYKRDSQRILALLPLDIIITLCLLVWAARLLP